MRSAKVVHISSVHPPGDSRIVMKECGTLSRAGFDVVFVCPSPSDGTVAGIPIRAVQRKKTRLARMTRTVWDIWRAARREQAAVYHLHDAELLPVALLLRLGGAAVVYDVHEDLPAAVRSKYWIPGPARSAVALAAGSVEWLAARAMSGIVAATPAIARRFPPGRTVVVQNFAMIDELRVDDPKPYSDREPLFVYVGGIASTRGASEMVAAINLVAKELGARLVLAGPVSHDAYLRELGEMHGWKRVDHYGWRSRTEVARLLHAARAGILVMHPTGNYIEAYPVKLFEYMVAGLPLIVSNFPLWRQLFEPVGCAIYVDPLDSSSLARAMEWVLRNPKEAEEMGTRGQIAVRESFNWQTEAAKLLGFYHRFFPDGTLRTIGARLSDA